MTDKEILLIDVMMAGNAQLRAADMMRSGHALNQPRLLELAGDIQKRAHESMRASLDAIEVIQACESLGLAGR